MPAPIGRGESSSQVNTWFPSTNKVTPNNFTSTILPYGLQLKQTINAGTTSVTIPAGITWVYAICVGGGGGGGSTNGSYGGGGGGMAWGWTLATSSCVVGAGAAANTLNTSYTRYGHIIAGYGGTGSVIQAGLLGGGGGGVNATTVGGGTNYWGIPGGIGSQSTSTIKGIGGGGAGASNTYGISASGGISGGGGGSLGAAGLIGGGSSGSGAGLGGKGVNILTGATYTPTGSGGAGIAGNGSGATGGLGGGGGGGGGSGGAGILYLFY